MQRCHLLDSLRGFTVLNMIAFHAVWDLVYIFGCNWNWYYGQGAYIWQQCICWTFILLSGFCSGISRHPFKRGLLVFGVGAGIMLFTFLFMPENQILFGVLTLIGSCMMIIYFFRNAFRKIPAYIGLCCSFLLFGLTKHINAHVLGFFGKSLISLPKELYRNDFTAYFGFPPENFYSTDYFSLIPWAFLFFTGFFLYALAGEKIFSCQWKGIPVFNFIGQHALEIYILHQPIIYGVLWIIFSMR